MNELREQAIQLRQQGLSVSLIARKLYVSRRLVSRWVRHVETPQAPVIGIMDELFARLCEVPQ